MSDIFAPDEAATRAAGAALASRLSTGDVVLLSGELGAGKTTFVRGLVDALGYEGQVRSPTYNLIQTFETDPPIMHADLYRVQSPDGIGLDDYTETHVCLIEWPDRAAGWSDPTCSWRVEIQFEGDGRRIKIVPPMHAQSIKPAI